MTIEELLSSQDELVSFAESENRPLTDEEVAKYEALEADLKAVQKSEEIKKRNAAYQAPRVTVLSQMPKSIKGRDTLEFAMDRYLRGDIGAAKELSGMEEQSNAKVVSFAQTETTTGGGYLLPTVTQDVMVKVQKAFGGISAKAAHINTNHGAPINFPSIDDTANSSAIAAINAAPGTAGADMVFGQVAMGAYKYAATGTGQAGLKVPRELIDDSLFDVTSLVTEMLGIRLARKMAADYAQGTGGGAAPSGLFWQTGNNLDPSGGLVQATAVNTLNKVIHSLDPAYLNDSCVWIMNWATHGVISGFVDSANRPLLQPNYTSGLNSPMGFTLLGYPVIIDQGSPVFSLTASANPAAVNESYLALGDFNEAFLIRDVQGIGIAVDPYGALSTNDFLYYGYARTDSVVRNRKAYVLSAGFHV